MINLERFYEDIVVYIPSDPDEYNEHILSPQTIKGKLFDEIKEIINKDNEQVFSKAILYTEDDLVFNTKIGNYLIIDKKECKDLYNNFSFYKYFLK